MKVIADERRRVVLPEPVHEGDVFEVERQSESSFLLTKVNQPSSSTVLVSRGDLLLLKGPGVITWEHTRDALDRFP